jgi:hypothetical protein
VLKFLETSFFSFILKVINLENSLCMQIYERLFQKRGLNVANKTKVQATDIITLPCGCIYQDKEWLLVRIHECGYHKRKRTAKKPYRPKAECVRP